MKENYFQAAIAILATLALFFFLGLAGDVDFTDQCILRMSQTEYDTIKQTLLDQDGHEPSEREIAHYWAEHNR